MINLEGVLSAMPTKVTAVTSGTGRCSRLTRVGCAGSWSCAWTQVFGCAHSKARSGSSGRGVSRFEQPWQQ